MNFISYFQACRDSVYNPNTKEYLLSKISGSEQEKDLKLPPNCNGYGRIRHFKRFIDDDWGLDALPIDPAIKALNLTYQDAMEAQVFQIASCNVNCWYCFVPNTLKRADNAKATWISASEMVDLFCREENEIRIIDLTGGNPELVPELIIDTMKVLEERNLADKIYLWSDDTLTTDYTFRFLNSDDLNLMRMYKKYGKVCCFKGFDSHSFSFNTNLPEYFYEQQFKNFSRYLELGLDIYGYVTFTTDNIENLDEKVFRFISELKLLHPLLPLRIVPLKIKVFSPTMLRINLEYKEALKNQVIVYSEWERQLGKFYSGEQIQTKICDIQLYK